MWTSVGAWCQFGHESALGGSVAWPFAGSYFRGSDRWLLVHGGGLRLGSPTVPSQWSIDACVSFGGNAGRPFA